MSHESEVREILGYLTVKQYSVITIIWDIWEVIGIKLGGKPASRATHMRKDISIRGGQAGGARVLTDRGLRKGRGEDQGQNLDRYWGNK